MLSRKIERALEEARRNMSGPMSLDSDIYVVGAFDFFGNTLSLSHTRSKPEAENTVKYYKQLPDVSSVIVERPGVGMKMWSATESGTWRVKEVRASDAVREAVAGRMPERFEAVADRVAAEWEAPTGGRKYWRKRREHGGYEYRETAPEDQKGGKKDESEVDQEKLKERVKEKVKEKTKKVYKNHVSLSKPELERTLSKGHFTILSAGRNPNDPKEKKLKPDDEFFHKRHEQLKDELEKAGYKYTEVVGHYGGKESSLLVMHDPEELSAKTDKSVMVHHKDSSALKKSRAAMEELGRKFNQDSVLHGDGGKNIMYFTTGEKKGQECSGKGWNEAPEAKDFFTDIKLEGKKHTKFQLDIRECIEKGFV